MTQPVHIGFISQHNAIRAQLAAALAHHICPELVIRCAGLTPIPIPEATHAVLRRLDAEPVSELDRIEALTASPLDLLIIICSPKEEALWPEASLQERLPEVETAIWHMGEPTSEEALAHLEIELAERLRLLLQARHLI